MGEEFGMRELIGEVIHNELWVVWMRNLMSCCVLSSDRLVRYAVEQSNLDRDNSGKAS